MNFSSFYSVLLLTPPRRRGQTTSLRSSTSLDISRHLSTSTTAGCDMSRCFERARARPGLAVMQRGKRPDIWVKTAARAPSMGNMGRLHPEQSTKHGLNYVQRSHNDHYIQIDSDFGCYAAQLGTLPKMPLFACQVQKSKGKCKMSHHWVII